MVFQEDAFRRLSSLTTSACGFAASALFAVPWVRALAARRRRLFLSFFETPIDPRLQGKYKMGGQLKELLSGWRRFGKRVPKKNNQRHMALLRELLAVAHP